MRLAELSERSGVPVGTIKYYLRERLLPPGRRVSATQAEYEDSHLRRLNLVRALIQIGRVPVANAREVLAHIDDDSLGTTMRLGAAMWAMPQPPEAPAEDPATVEAAAGIERFLADVGWDHAREIGTLSPSYRRLVTTVAVLTRLGYACGPEILAAYARQMDEVARLDLERLEDLEGDVEKAELVVAASVLFEPVLLALHRLAQEEHSTRRYGL
ncbi:MerR family transcriptional regulator [Streptomyces sp. SID8379]|uniref:MerR family transcriptional regulator n=1 Tax=unclassified Streptomyces TaxID=2593676 RepID=UPI00037863E0|nr:MULTISPECIES: MerR family transcriptional regulator [unclassified Streptomyces]MYW70041.1 MerR family transcriptional regulator [Streptomyces sp. SID8379]